VVQPDHDRREHWLDNKKTVQQAQTRNSPSQSLQQGASRGLIDKSMDLEIAETVDSQQLSIRPNVLFQFMGNLGIGSFDSFSFHYAGFSIPLRS
jgi:hypothetical protein